MKENPIQKKETEWHLQEKLYTFEGAFVCLITHAFFFV